MSVYQPIIRSRSLGVSVRNFPDDWHYRLAAQDLPGKEVVFVFGRNTDVGTGTFEPISNAGLYWTPQANAGDTLYVQSSDANDTAAGSGAREITIVGINASGEIVTDALATNGTSASSATSNTYIRLLKAYVSKSGTYGTQSAGSHAGLISIRQTTGATTRGQIQATGFPRSATQIGVYTIPTGKKGYIEYLSVNVDSNKTANLALFKRGNILQTAAPYDAIEVLAEFPGVSGSSEFSPSSPINSLIGPCDIGFMGIGLGQAAEIAVSFELILVDA